MSVQFAGWLLAAGGLSATTGWALFALFDPGHHRRAEPSWLRFNMPIILGGVLISLGLTGFSQGREAWEVAFVLALAAGIAISHIGVHSLETAGGEAGSLFVLLVSIAQPLLVAGAVGLGAAILRDPVYPVWLGILFLAGVAASAATRLAHTPPVLERGWIPAFGAATLGLIGVLSALSG